MKSIARPVCALLATIPLFVAGAGCAKDNVALKLACSDSGATYRQQFTSAYVSQGLEGTEIVLVNDENVSASSTDASTAGHSSATSVRQVMHLRILWKPERGTKQGHPSYTNAALRWYVFGENGTGNASDVLEYTGAGFVALSDTALGTKVTIRNASVKPAGIMKGSLNDPIGPANLTGSFFATKSAERVNELLTEVKTAVGGGSAQQASAN